MNQDNIFIEDWQDEGPKKEERVFGVACYIPFLGLVMPTLTGTVHTPFTLLHYRQGWVLFALYFAVIILIYLLPFVGLKIWWISTLAYFLLSSWAGYQAYLGNAYEYSFLKPLIKKVVELIEKNSK